MSRYSEILNTLEKLETDEGFISLQVIRKVDFMFHIYMMNEICRVTHTLSKYLHNSNTILKNALTLVKITVESLQSVRYEDDFKGVWNEAIRIFLANNIDEPVEKSKRKVPLCLGGDDVLPNNLTIQDEYRINSDYAVLGNIIISINNRFNENYLLVVVLNEILSLTKGLLNENELKLIARFHKMSYDNSRGEQRLYKTVIDINLNGI